MAKLDRVRGSGRSMGELTVRDKTICAGPEMKYELILNVHAQSIPIDNVS